MKDAVRKITQPTSRRIGSALSYLAVGDAFSKNKDYDGAACSYYSALLLSHNLVASVLEKSAVKKMVYERMKAVAEIRQQTYLAGLFGLVTDLNASFINSPFAKSSDQEYYDGLKKIAEVCFNAESQARNIRSQQRMSNIQSLLAVAGSVAQASVDKTNKIDQYALENQIKGFDAPVQQSKAIFAETLQDLKYENFNVKDESGNEIELNRLYLNLEVLWHLAIRKDQDVVGMRLLKYAADKPNLKIALEEYLAEDDPEFQVQAISEFQKCFLVIELQVNSYESWGKKLPKKVVRRF